MTLEELCMKNIKTREDILRLYENHMGMGLSEFSSSYQELIHEVECCFSDVKSPSLNALFDKYFDAYTIEKEQKMFCEILQESIHSNKLEIDQINDQLHACHIRKFSWFQQSAKKQNEQQIEILKLQLQQKYKEWLQNHEKLHSKEEVLRVIVETKAIMQEYIKTSSTIEQYPNDFQNPEDIFLYVVEKAKEQKIPVYEKITDNTKNFIYQFVKKCVLEIDIHSKGSLNKKDFYKRPPEQPLGFVFTKNNPMLRVVQGESHKKIDENMRDHNHWVELGKLPIEFEQWFDSSIIHMTIAEGEKEGKQRVWNPSDLFQACAKTLETQLFEQIDFAKEMFEETLVLKKDMGLTSYECDSLSSFFQTWKKEDTSVIVADYKEALSSVSYQNLSQIEKIGLHILDTHPELCLEGKSPLLFLEEKGGIYIEDIREMDIQTWKCQVERE